MPSGLRRFVPILLLVMASCSSGSSSTSSGSTSSPSTSLAPSSSAAPTSSGPTTTFKPALAGTGDVFFVSPSKNIGCALSATAVRCDIRDRSWSPPPRPASCELDFGQGVSIVGKSPATLTCAGDTTLVGDQALEYGTAVTRGDFECRSETSAMRCRNVASGHAFSLSKERYEIS